MLSKLNFIQEKGVGDFFFLLTFKCLYLENQFGTMATDKEATIVWAQGPSLEGMLK